MVYFEQHVAMSPATEVLIRLVVRAIISVGILLALSIVLLALALGCLSYVLWTKDRKPPLAHRDDQKLDGRKHE
jgi:hypothetical protein